MLRTWLLYYTSKMITMSFSKGKCVSVYKGKDGIFKIKEKNVKMGWMNGIPCVDCRMLEDRTNVVEQEGWEISILSQLRTELMCHLA